MRKFLSNPGLIVLKQTDLQYHFSEIFICNPWEQMHFSNSHLKLLEIYGFPISGENPVASTLFGFTSA